MQIEKYIKIKFDVRHLFVKFSIELAQRKIVENNSVKADGL